MRHIHVRPYARPGQLQLLRAGRGDVRRGRVRAAAGPQAGLLLANGIWNTYRVHDPECNTVCTRLLLYGFIIVCMKSAPRELGEGRERGAHTRIDPSDRVCASPCPSKRQSPAPTRRQPQTHRAHSAQLSALARVTWRRGGYFIVAQTRNKCPCFHCVPPSVNCDGVCACRALRVPTARPPDARGPRLPFWLFILDSKYKPLVCVPNQASWYEYSRRPPQGLRQGRTRGYSYERDWCQI